MVEHDWQRLLYLVAWLALLGPACYMQWQTHGRIWRDLAIWIAIIGVLATVYQFVEPS